VNAGIRAGPSGQGGTEIAPEAKTSHKAGPIAVMRRDQVAVSSAGRRLLGRFEHLIAEIERGLRQSDCPARRLRPCQLAPCLPGRYLELGLRGGAGDENRTRTISLGSLGHDPRPTWQDAELWQLLPSGRE
jgi:hypothetical protein